MFNWYNSHLFGNLGIYEIECVWKKDRKLICEAQTQHYSFDAEIIHQWQDELITTYPQDRILIIYQCGTHSTVVVLDYIFCIINLWFIEVSEIISPNEVFGDIMVLASPLPPPPVDHDDVNTPIKKIFNLSLSNFIWYPPEVLCYWNLIPSED